MPITDNRTLLDVADATTNFVDTLGGTMGLTANTSRLRGSFSIALQVDNEKLGTLYDAGSPQNWSGNVFYIWWNCTTANLLRTKAAGGVALRFTSSGIGDYFEIFIEGSDTYSGGWKMSVVDIDEAWALVNSSPNAEVGAIGGTGASPNFIQRVGIVWDVNGMIPGTDPNTFTDALWRLPPNEPGIIVSGNAGGSPELPWNWQDIVDAADIADTTKAWGTITQNDGVIKVNTPIQFGQGGLYGVDGAPDSPDAGNNKFADTNKVIAWESQIVKDSFYGFSVFGDNVNEQSFQAGISTGNVGSQGWVITADADGPRWFLECSSVFQDATLWGGCSLIHTSWVDIDNVNVDFLNNSLIDGQRLIHSRA